MHNRKLYFFLLQYKNRWNIFVYVNNNNHNNNGQFNSIPQGATYGQFNKRVITYVWPNASIYLITATSLMQVLVSFNLLLLVQLGRYCSNVEITRTKHALFILLYPVQRVINGYYILIPTWRRGRVDWQEREREREREGVCVSVCVCACCEIRFGSINLFNGISTSCRLLKAKIWSTGWPKKNRTHITSTKICVLLFFFFWSPCMWKCLIVIISIFTMLYSILFV